MPIPQEKKFCGMGILPVLVIFARGLIIKFLPIIKNRRYPSGQGRAVSLLYLLRLKTAIKLDDSKRDSTLRRRSLKMPSISI
ncbi:hypothetical protein QUB70_19320 [Microcoleus sp. A003_D6]